MIERMRKPTTFQKSKLKQMIGAREKSIKKRSSKGRNLF